MNSKIIVFDIDGTLVKEKSIWEYILRKHNKWTNQGGENLEKYLNNELSYTDFCHKDAELLKGYSYSLLKKTAYSVPKYNGLDALFEYLNKNSYIVCLLSSGLKLLVDYFLENYKIDYYIVNDLESNRDICTGRAVVNINDKNKGRFIDDIIRKFGKKHLAAIGDSGGDISVFKKADYSIAVNASNSELIELADVSLQTENLQDLVQHLQCI